ncbi:MAG: hypothetical protein ACOH1Y_18310 [Propionicimonas sp.]
MSGSAPSRTSAQVSALLAEFRKPRSRAPAIVGALTYLVGFADIATGMARGWRERLHPLTEVMPGVIAAASAATVVSGILLVVLGAVALGPWVAFRSGQRAARRTSDPATLIAASHLISDPHPAGRAAAAVGAISMVSGVAAVMEVGIFFYSSFINPFFVTSFALVGVALIVVLLVTASTLAVHAAESLVDRRRVLAALVAAGTPVSVLRDALRREATLTCLPLSLGGLLIGAGVAGVVGAAGAAGAADPGLILAGLLLVGVQLAATVALTRLAIALAIRVVRRPLLLATAPANLRTE